MSDNFLIKVQWTLQGDNSLTQLTLQRRTLDRIKIEVFESNICFTFNSDRINTDSFTKYYMRTIEDRTKLIIASPFNQLVDKHRK